jgi:hypothetical protein
MFYFIIMYLVRYFEIGYTFLQDFLKLDMDTLKWIYFNWI